MDETPNSDVSTEASLDTGVSIPADAPVGTSPEAAQPDVASPDGQSTEEAAAPFKVPENDDDLKGQENNPHVPTIIQMRREIRERDGRLDEFNGWKPLVEKQVDPSVALANHELVSLLHSPVVENGVPKPDEYTTKPFLERLETESPGSVDQIFADLLSYPVPGQDGKVDTLVRQLYRSHGLNPDNLAQYQALEKGTLGIASGIVSSDDLAKIEPQFHDAFKSLSPSNRTDILALQQSANDTDRLNAAENLRNAKRALDAENFEKQIREKDERSAQAQQEKLENEIVSESEASIQQATEEIYSSIKQSLASQVTVSSDPIVNESYQTGVMSNLFTLLDPMGRKLIVEPLLAKMGVSLDSTIAGVQVPFDQTVNRFAERLAAAKKYEKYGDQMRARQALSEATQARQLLTATLNKVALKLAQPALGSVKSNGNLGATARTIPNGNGVQQQGSQNPYDANPHPFGTQEYIAFNRKLDRELSLSGTAVFSN